MTHKKKNIIATKSESNREGSLKWSSRGSLYIKNPLRYFKRQYRKTRDIGCQSEYSSWYKS